MSARVSGFLARSSFLAALLALPLLLGSCKTVGFKEIYMARDGGGKLRAKTFSTENTEIHTIIRYSSGRDDGEMTATLTFTDADGNSNDSPIELASDAPIILNKGDGTLDLQLATVTKNEQGQRSIVTTGPWPEGDYTIKVSVKDEDDTSTSFFVRAPADQ